MWVWRRMKAVMLFVGEKSKLWKLRRSKGGSKASRQFFRQQ